MTYLEALDIVRPIERIRWLCSDENLDIDGPSGREAYRQLMIDRANGKRNLVGPELPPITAQIANAGAALVRLGIQFLTGGPLLVTEAELDRRLAICQPCPKFNGSRCTDCGCFGNLKARLESETGQCPDGRW